MGALAETVCGGEPASRLAAWRLQMELQVGARSGRFAGSGFGPPSLHSGAILPRQMQPTRRRGAANKARPHFAATAARETRAEKSTSFARAPIWTQTTRPALSPRAELRTTIWLLASGRWRSAAASQ